MSKDGLKVVGTLTITKTNSQNETTVQVIPNIIVDDGLNLVLSSLVDNDGTNDRPSPISHMAIGNGDGSGVAEAQIATDTQLQNEITIVGRKELSGTTLNYDDHTLTFSCVFNAGEGSGAVCEAGLFNSDVDGKMLARTTFDVNNKGEGDTMTINWSISATNN